MKPENWETEATSRLDESGYPVCSYCGQDLCADCGCCCNPDCEACINHNEIEH